MNLTKYRIGSTIKVLFKDGTILTGKVDDFTSSWDNDDEGDYLTIIPLTGRLKGLDVQVNQFEVKAIMQLSK
ncbi:hypothetical protein [Limosilactobacillus caccae]|uniref:hypothetical protein n=1 Tax=Limosilactobacillus caccae TaxID=1926284 RepID=UPI000970E200|nr:hypothetical protein [Limosilactobacillus caccae]